MGKVQKPSNSNKYIMFISLLHHFMTLYQPQIPSSLRETAWWLAWMISLDEQRRQNVSPLMTLLRATSVRRAAVEIQTQSPRIRFETITVKRPSSISKITPPKNLLRESWAKQNQRRSQNSKRRSLDYAEGGSTIKVRKFLIGLY